MVCIPVAEEQGAQGRAGDICLHEAGAEGGARFCLRLSSKIEVLLPKDLKASYQHKVAGTTWGFLVLKAPLFP